MADEMTKGNFSGRAGAHVANVTRKWREEARAGSKTGIASEANDRREIFGPKPEKPNKTGIATEALDRREIKGCGLKPGTMRKAMDFIKKDWPAQGFMTPKDLKNRSAKRAREWENESIRSTKMGDKPGDYGKIVEKYPGGFKNLNAVYDRHQNQKEADATNLDQEKFAKPKAGYQPTGGDRSGKPNEWSSPGVKKDIPASPGERAKLLGQRATQAAGVRSQRQMADEDISEVAQKADLEKGGWQVEPRGDTSGRPLRRAAARNPKYSGSEPKYTPGETDQRSGPKVSHVSQMPKCEKSSDSKASPLHSEIAARAFGHTGKNMPVHLAPGTVKKAMDFISKAKGVPSGPGQPPGPPPRPGLQWDVQKHKWLRPEEVSSGQGKVYSGRDAYEEFYDDYYQALKKEVGKTLNKRQLSEADDLITEMAQYSWNEAAGKFNDMKTVSEADAKAAVAECMKDLKDNASTVKDKFGELGDLGDL